MCFCTTLDTGDTKINKEVVGMEMIFQGRKTWLYNVGNNENYNHLALFLTLKENIFSFTIKYELVVFHRCHLSDCKNFYHYLHLK